MRKVSRTRRAEITHRAHRIRQHGQLTGWEVERIVAAIVDELPEITLLEARRLAYGWTRRHVIDGIAALYVADGLAAPPLNSSMLCRWDHGRLLPSAEYVDALCRLYKVEPDRLGLAARTSSTTRVGGRAWHGRPRMGDPHRIDVPEQRTEESGYRIPSGATPAALAAVRESIQLVLEVEGPIGGPLTREQFEQAIDYYASNYSAFTPGMLAAEVQRCRALVTGMLGQLQTTSARNDLRRLAGWLSALLGNLAFHLGDHPAACIHLGTAERLGAGVGDTRLICWSLGAQSMVARHQHRHTVALHLARRGLAHTTTPLTRAQMLAWAELPALARLGTQHRSEAARVVTAARHEMDADPNGEQPGRFGFDMAELELHIAEAHLALDDPTRVAAHAQASLEHTTIGRPGWAAATLVLAASELQRSRPDQAADLAITVLDTIPPYSLRETARRRLASIDSSLCALDQPGRAARELHERLRSLPSLNAPALASNDSEGP